MQNTRGALASRSDEICLGGSVDVFLATEIWLQEAATLPEIPGFSRSFSAARPQRVAGSGRGGVASFIRDGLDCDVSVWRERASDGVLWLRICRTGESLPIFLGFCYLPPAGSGGCPSDVGGWFQRLGEDATVARAIGDVLIAGDLNARVAEQPDFEQSSEWGVDAEVDMEDSTATAIPRSSIDPTVNSHGRELLLFCKSTGMRILNGRVAGDIPAAATSLGSSGEGCAVVDVFLACPKLFQKVESISVGTKLLAATDHNNVTLKLNLRPDNMNLTAAGNDEDLELPTPPQELQNEFILEPKKMAIFQEFTRSPEIALRLESIMNAANEAVRVGDVSSAHAAALEFNNCVRDVCVLQLADFREKSRDTPQPEWFRRARRSSPVLRAMRAAQRVRRRAVRRWQVVQSIALRARIRALAQRDRRVKRIVKQKKLEDLLEEDPAEFYKRYRSKKPSLQSVIPNQVMNKHWKDLLSPAVPDLPVPPGMPGAVPQEEQLGELLQESFSVEEVATAIKKTRNGASVLGLIKPQLLKAAPVLIPALTACLNACAEVGSFPNLWAMSAITALPKAGSDPTLCDGYRGIAVGTLPSKIYAAVLNNRVAPWAEMSKIRAEGQFGFRKGRGTGHAAFVLRSVVESVRAEKKKAYVCYVDFKKAYDSVPRHLLWAKLERRGVRGWVLKAIMALYDSVPMCVRNKEGLGGYFQSTMGVKQGCPLSPLLFGLFLDDLEGELNEAQRVNGNLDLPLLGGRLLACLMYADNLALLSTTAAGLQRQISVLEDYAKRWGLTINVAKTKAMVFSSNKSISRREQLMLDCAGGQVQVEDAFKYLGVGFHCASSFGKYAAPARKVNGLKAMHNTVRRMNILKLSAPRVQCRLFDVMVETVLSYGAEVWAPEFLCKDPCANPSEKVHLAFLRRLLGVRKGTANRVVLAECGRWPLALRWIKRIIKFYNKVVKLPEDDLLFCALKASCDLALGPVGSLPLTKQPWAQQVNTALRQLGLNPDLENPQPLNARLVCEAWQECYLAKTREETGTKINYYVHQVRGGLPRTEYTMPQYLIQLPRFGQRFRLSQMIVGSHWLKEETGRWERLQREERICPLCTEQAVQTLHHVMFNCPAYQIL